MSLEARQPFLPPPLREFRCIPKDGIYVVCSLISSLTNKRAVSFVLDVADWLKHTPAVSKDDAYEFFFESSKKLRHAERNGRFRNWGMILREAIPRKRTVDVIRVVVLRILLRSRGREEEEEEEAAGSLSVAISRVRESFDDVESRVSFGSRTRFNRR